MLEQNKVYQGDCFEIMKQIPDNSVEAIITDLPYPKKYLPLYIKLAEEASRILVKSGSLLVILPHYAIPELTEGISKHLKMEMDIKHVSNERQNTLEWQWA